MVRDDLKMHQQTFCTGFIQSIQKELENLNRCFNFQIESAIDKFEVSGATLIQNFELMQERRQLKSPRRFI